MSLKRYLQTKDPEALKKLPDRRIATVAVTHKNHLLMGKRRDNDSWTTPGGHMEDGEEPHKAALREMEEESGIKGNHARLVPLGKSSTVTNDKGEKIEVHPFRYDSHGRPSTSMRNDPDAEVHRWTWVDISKGLPDHIESNLHVPLHRNVLLKRVIETKDAP